VTFKSPQVLSAKIFSVMCCCFKDSVKCSPSESFSNMTNSFPIEGEFFGCAKFWKKKLEDFFGSLNSTDPLKKFFKIKFIFYKASQYTRYG